MERKITSIKQFSNEISQMLIKFLSDEYPSGSLILKYGYEGKYMWRITIDAVWQNEYEKAYKIFIWGLNTKKSTPEWCAVDYEAPIDFGTIQNPRLFQLEKKYLTPVSRNLVDAMDATIQILKKHSETPIIEKVI